MAHGLPEHVPTQAARSKVMAFSCAGYNQTQIADYFQIDEKTLRKYYRYELDGAKMEKITTLSNSTYKMALEGNEKMIEFVLKCQGRWSYAKAPEETDLSKAVTTVLEMAMDKL